MTDKDASPSTALISVKPNTEVNLGNADIRDEADGFTRIEHRDVLEPGCYWRVKDSREPKKTKGYGEPLDFLPGDIHLLIKVNVHDECAHSVVLLDHPRNGGASHQTLMIDDFLAHFEPVTDEEAERVRAAEQAAVMKEVADLQEEMAQAQLNPLSLPGVREAAEEAVERFEREEAARVQQEVEDTAKRQQDIRRVLRRAARRSEAKGNPLAVRRATISDRVDVMISEGITSDGVRELSLEAGRRVAIAEAASKWLSSRAEDMGKIMKRLTPYYAEKPQVALAKSHEAIQYVKTLSAGIDSLKLYTGDNVTVVTLQTGADAPTYEPLTLLQAKRYMDEELAVWAQVEDSFDWKSQEVFFRELLANRELFNQVLPKPRCVVSMAVTARRIEYGREMHAFDRLINDLKNRAVFLLVRNGENVHVVYSLEPSHEASPRLFPTREESDSPFRGVDGTTIGLSDIRFSKAMAEHDNLALHYKRFLILLCGLDHREQLFGDFYPREDGLKFMSLDFQSKYFRFVEDDDDSLLLDTGERPGVFTWIKDCNSFVRSGSRIVVSNSQSLAAMSSIVGRTRNFRIAHSSMPDYLVASASKGFHRIQVPVVDRHDPSNRKQSSVWLDGPDADETRETWFLCIDNARLTDVRAYLYGRRFRTSDISWLRTLRRVEKTLAADAEQQIELRDYLRTAALEARVLSEADVDDAIEMAISTWRAQHRGASAPDVTDTAEVNALLTLMYPADRIADSTRSMAQAFADERGEIPLRVARAGTARLAIYTEVPELERQVLRGAVIWGWVKRYSIVEKRGKLTASSSALVWIKRDAQSAAEEVLHDWPQLENWLNADSEPIKPRVVEQFLAEMDASAHMATVIEQRGAFASKERLSVDSFLTEECFAAIIAGYRKRIREARYYVNSSLVVPIGVYHKVAKAKPVFLYASLPVGTAIKRYGTEEQQTAFRRYMHSSKAARSEFNDAPYHWNIIGLHSPTHGPYLVLDNKYDPIGLKWLSVETRAPGGIKKNNDSFWDKSTRRSRREEGAKPRLHHQTGHQVSLNRAFDNLMGTNPALRRQYYKSVNERIRSVVGLLRTAEDVAKAKIERERRYDPIKPGGVYLSPMVWSHKLGRGVAAKLFGRNRPRES